MRLWKSEQASILLQNEPNISAEEVTKIVLGDNAQVRFTESDLTEEINIVKFGRNLEIIRDIKKYHTHAKQTIFELKSDHPYIYQSLKDDAHGMGVSIEMYLKMLHAESVDHYIATAYNRCIIEIDKILYQKRFLRIKQLVRDRDSIISDGRQRLYSRYQTSIDNEFYKALKALREQQKYRMFAIDGDAVKVDDK
jgi:hypothetical protein